MPLRHRHCIAALLLGLVACGGDDRAGPHAVPAAIAIVAGATQSGTVAKPLPTPLTVAVQDRDGDPVQGVTVRFALSATDGALSATAAQTDASGRASTIWTLPTTTGRYTASAWVAPLDSVQFEATAVAAAAGSITVLSGDSQVTTAGAFADSAIVVRVTDPFGNPVPAQALVLAPSGDGAVPESPILTDSLGIARTTWIVGATRRIGVLRFIATSVLSRGVTGFALSAVTPDSVAISWLHGCALERGGALLCWGFNGSGEVGNGSTITAFTPAVLGTGTGFRSLGAGNSTTCALDGSGAAYCWGVTGSVSSSVPAPVAGGLAYTSLSAGAGHACGVVADGSAYCWGENGHGQLGNGTRVSRSSPTIVSGGHRFRRIDAGDRVTCGITPQGRAYCWGLSVNIPVRVNTSQVFDQVSAAGTRACGLNADGEPYCWSIGSSLPQAVATPLRFRSVSAAIGFACGVATSGSAYCWGENQTGQLGIGFADWNPLAAPDPPVSGGNVFTEVHASGQRACGLAASGAVICWGSNWMGAMGIGDPSRLVPDSVFGGHRFSQLVAGQYHTCGLALDGSTWCWGENSQGQLGLGNRQWHSVPQLVSGAPALAALAADGYTTCGITTSGVAHCWGISASLSLAPVLVPGNQTFATIAAGFGWGCGTTGTGAALCFGGNGEGQLGDGTTTGFRVSAPVAVAGGHLFQGLAAGSSHTCGVTTQGIGLCWGGNHVGQLGDGTLNSSNLPVAVSGGYVFRRVTAAFARTCGITTPDDAYCWGSNTLQPAIIPGGLKWSQLASTIGTDCGISLAGTTYCRGDGYLGRGSVEASPDPVPVSGAHALVALTAGARHTCGLDTAGQAWCWGENAFGELGNGERMANHQPVPLPLP